MALAKLVVDLVLRAQGFETDMGRASATAKKRARELEAEAKKIGAAIGVALAASATAIGYAVKSAIDRADEMYNAAQKVGIGTKEFSGLAYAAKMAGVEMEQLQGSIGKLVKFQSAAAQGNETAKETFAAFGIAIKDAGGNLRSTTDLLGDWANVFQHLEDGPNKVALALRVFGKSGQELIPFLNEGRTGLKDLVAEAERLGYTIDDNTGKAADEFNDKLDKLKATLGGVALAIAKDALPYLNNFADGMQHTAEKTTVFSDSIQILATALGYVKSAIGGVVSIAQALGAQFAYVTIQVENAITAAKGWATLDFGSAATSLLNMQDESQRRRDAMRGIFGIGDTAPKGPTMPAGWARSVGAAALGTGTQGANYNAAATGLFGTEDPDKKKTNAASEAKKRAAEAARRQAEAERDLAEAVKKVADANTEFTRTAEDMAAERAGPLAEATLNYERKLADLRKAAKDGEVSAVALKAAEADLAAQYAKTRKELEERLNPQRALIASLDLELASLSALNDEERMRLELMAEYKNASTEEIDTIIQRTQEIDKLREQIEVADMFRGHFEDAFASILDGTKSVKDAFKDMASAILSDIARMIARKWVTQLFGNFGTTLPGVGDFFGNAMGNAFAGGAVTAFARGGVVSSPTLFPMARGMGLMGEAGPEAVMPLQRMADGHLGIRAKGGAPVVNIHIEGKVTRETVQQISTKVMQSVAFAGRAA